MISEKEFLQAINDHQNIIHKVCNLYAHQNTDKEDLFQEILMNAWNGIKNFKGESKFTTWLYRVALNTAITSYKKERKQSRIIGQDVAENVDIPEDKESAEQLEAMQLAIDELSSIDKALVMLYFDGFSHQEIGEILGISENNVAVKMNRIKTRLKELTKKFL